MSEAGAWNAIAPEWVKLVRRAGHDEAYDAVLRELLPDAAGLAVDVGCGEGRWTRTLADAGWDAVGVDRSAALVEAARAAHPEGRYVVGEAESLPLEDGIASLVLCVNVLMHVVDLEAAIAELRRVLVAGGTLVLRLFHPIAEAGTFDEERDALIVSHYFEREEHPIAFGEHHVAHQHRTIEHYVRSLLAAGFALDDLREIPGRTGSVPRFLDLRLRV